MDKLSQTPLIGDDFDDQEQQVSIAEPAGQMDRSLQREIGREARYFAKLVPDVLATVGYDHWIRKEARPSMVEAMVTGRRSHQKLRIMHVAYNEAAIYLRIDPLRLPYRVTVPMLKDEEVMETLSVACGRKVTFELKDYSKGCWFVISRDGALGSIPKLLTFKDAVNNIPPSAGPLRYCAGVGENMRLLIPDLEKAHLLVAGATLSGKSVHLHAIISQLILRNPPDRIQFLMVDLKGGMELQDYAELDSYMWKPIVTSIEDTVDALQAYRIEMKRRQDLMAGSARSLPEYNRYHPNARMPYIILVIDELAQILTDPRPKLAKAAMLELGLILAVARATGGYCIVCTQHPRVEVVSGYLKCNLDSRIAFKTASQSDSRVILDVSDAAELELQGRAMMKYGPGLTKVQCPMITPYQIRRVVNMVKEREQGGASAEVTIEEVLRASLDYHGGSMAYRDLYNEFGGRISEKALRTMLAAVDGETIQIGDVIYTVIPGNNNRPRRVEIVEMATEASAVQGEAGSGNGAAHGSG